jgi:ABC-type Fe3+/spermidine/putrescine transport system ATPase subunit
MGLRVSGLTLRIKGDTILDGVSFEAPDGAFVSLLGPSGAGKSTTLKAIAGLVETDEGEVCINGTAVDGTPAYRRACTLVFQDARLFPHLNVIDNVAFPLKMKRLSRDERHRQAREMLELVSLSHKETSDVGHLSGGQRQRVSLARALVARPDVLLLDEPFSGLDENLRDEMRVLVVSLHRRLGITTVMVTHDVHEALELSDSIVYMADGRTIQQAPPLELFSHPATPVVSLALKGIARIEGDIVDGFLVSGDLRFPLVDNPSITRNAQGRAAVWVRSFSGSAEYR